jgi:MerR family redox-sensitive transcriptional activator SoxR
MTDQLLAIGQLAERTGVAVSALRHYHELGVIEPATRIGGKRQFTPDAIGRVNFIRRAQRFGFSLSEIGELLGCAGLPPRTVLDSRLEKLRSQQEELQQTIQTLEALRKCGCEALETCPALASGT